MKFFKTQNLYKASNVTFEPTKRIATSYAWWDFVRVVDGYTVFNAYNYSPTTIKHQYKVRALLRDLGIRIDFECCVRESLKATDTIQGLTDRTAQTKRELEENKKLKAKLYRERVKARRLELKNAPAPLEKAVPVTTFTGLRLVKHA